MSCARGQTGDAGALVASVAVVMNKVTSRSGSSPSAMSGAKALVESSRK